MFPLFVAQCGTGASSFPQARFLTKPSFASAFVTGYSIQTACPHLFFIFPSLPLSVIHVPGLGLGRNVIFGVQVVMKLGTADYGYLLQQTKNYCDC